MPRTARPKQPPALIGVITLVVFAVVLVGLHLLANRPSAPPAATPVKSSASHGTSGLPVVRLATLPAEAQRTVRLIAAGGPFPYARDGITFSNREGVLPQQASGYYREYTVITPGSSDRGARRVIAGRGGEEYYTDDHYASFREIVS